MQGESNFKNNIPDPVKTSDVYAYQTVKQLRQIVDILNDMTKLLAFVIPSDNVEKTVESVPEIKNETEAKIVSKRVSRKKKEVK